MTLYYYEDYVLSDDEDIVEMYIAENETYCGEEGLMNIFENDIGTIDTFDELLEYCKEYDLEMKDLYALFGVDIKEMLE